MSERRLKVMLVQPAMRTYKRYTPPILSFMDKMMSQLNLSLPIGILQVAACVRDICDLEILDCTVGNKVTVESEDGSYSTLGLAEGEIRRRIRLSAPDVVGIGSQFAPQEDEALCIASLVKQECPGAIVVLGGANTSVRYEALLQYPPCDYCVVGEGEITFREFLESISAGLDPAGIPGVASRSHRLRERAYINNLDSLPFPAYDFADPSYFTEGKMPIVTSRGCPFHCTFCSIHLHMGEKFRFNSVDYVKRHLEHCVHNLGVRWFSFEDDNISLKQRRWEALLDMMTDMNPGIQWFTRNGIRADTLNLPLLRKMKASGCDGLIYAVESGNSRVLNDVIKKRTSLEKVSEIIELTHGLGIPMAGFYIVGFPGETLDEMRDTTRFALDHFRCHGVYPFLFFATPLVGTELYKECEELGIIQNGSMISGRDWALATNHFGKRMITTSEFSARDLAAVELAFTEQMAEIFISRHLGKWDVARIPSRIARLFFSRRLRAQTKEYSEAPPEGITGNPKPVSRPQALYQIDSPRHSRTPGNLA